MDLTTKYRDFPTVTLLITHFNRSGSLEKLLQTTERLKISFAEIVVSDDASNQEHLFRLHQLKKKFPFTLIGAQKNSGLGNNLNKGQSAVNTPYTLYIQEDFVPMVGFPEAFEQALSIMERDKAIDLVGFYAYSQYPYLIDYDTNYSLKTYQPWYTDTNKIYQYSDHPHLRRTSFLEKFGEYKEGIKSDKTEYQMCISFLKNKGKAIIHRDFQSLLKQENTTLEPSTVRRASWRQSKNPFIAIVRSLYRQVKYNYDIHISSR